MSSNFSDSSHDDQGKTESQPADSTADNSDSDLFEEGPSEDTATSDAEFAEELDMMMDGGGQPAEGADSQQKPADDELDSFFEDLSSIEDMDENEASPTPSTESPVNPKTEATASIRALPGYLKSVLGSVVRIPGAFASLLMKSFDSLNQLMENGTRFMFFLQATWFLFIVSTVVWILPRYLEVLVPLEIGIQLPVMFVLTGILLFCCAPIPLTGVILRTQTRYFSGSASMSVLLSWLLIMIVDVAKVARRSILAIEDSLPSIENEMLREGLRLAVDGVDESYIRIKLDNATEKYQMVSRQNLFHLLFTAFYALVGGTILCLSLSLTVDPVNTDQIWMIGIGSLIWMALFLVLAGKYQGKCMMHDIEYRLIREGVLMIHKQERALFVEELLCALLPPRIRQQYEAIKTSTLSG